MEANKKRRVDNDGLTRRESICVLVTLYALTRTTIYLTSRNHSSLHD